MGDKMITVSSMLSLQYSTAKPAILQNELWQRPNMCGSADLLRNMLLTGDASQHFVGAPWKESVACHWFSARYALDVSAEPSLEPEMASIIAQELTQELQEYRQRFCAGRL